MCRKRANFGPILGLFEAIFGLPVAARGPKGQLWYRKREPDTEPETHLAQFRWASVQKIDLNWYWMGGGA